MAGLHGLARSGGGARGRLVGEAALRLGPAQDAAPKEDQGHDAPSAVGDSASPGHAMNVLIHDFSSNVPAPRDVAPELEQGSRGTARIDVIDERAVANPTPQLHRNLRLHRVELEVKLTPRHADVVDHGTPIPLRLHQPPARALGHVESLVIEKHTNSTGHLRPHDQPRVFWVRQVFARTGCMPIKTA